jgi:hypothetical protein
MRYRYPLFRHSEHMEEVLFLIREQLKSRRFFNAMRSLGVGESIGEVHLEALILHMMEIDDGSDEVINFFSMLLDKHSQEFDEDLDTLDKSAVVVYSQLVGKWGNLGTRD